MNKSESIIKLAVALSKFNSEVSSISKDAKNPFFKSDYVTLDKLILATREILQKNGLSVLQIPLSKETGEIGVQTILLHESGEYIESSPLFMKPIKSDPQTAGSLITYLRRYSYQAVLNLNTGEDDDGNLPTHGDKKSNCSDKNKFITEAQQKRLFALSKGNTKLVKDTLMSKGYTSSSEIPKGDIYNHICSEIESKVKEG